MTTLRRLARPIPCHFALGRNRKLQGLAASIVKLWEKCEIAKIAIKRGVQNTNTELMAEELKWLTGGTLLSRDREFIVFYRGKDFLPAAVSSAIEERRKHVMTVSKTRTGDLSILNAEEHKHGTKEYAAESEHDEENYQKLRRTEERKLRFSEAAMERTRSKLSLALAKKARAEKLLAQLEKEQIPQTSEIDKEGITEEERYMLRKMGLRMKPFLLLGRRGVFDGTIENMHLHWKYRELVKVCIGRRSIEEIHGIARTLEAESGGILVAIERVSKGYAIIVYRGKNYTRPASLRPRTLLSKREAMKRSLEAQRRESLKLHVLKLSQNIEELKLKMAKDEDNDDMKLTDDWKLGFAEQGTNENHFNYNKISHEESETESNDQPYFGDLESDGQFYFGEPANKAGESHETSATSTEPEEPMHTSKESVLIVQQDVQGDVSSESTIKRNYLFATTEAEIQPRSLPNKTKGFLNRNEQNGNAEVSSSFRSQDQTSSRTATGKDSVGYQNAELEYLNQKATDERPSVRALQLSNKERLLLRKQALKMNKPPVLAVGKSNVITGLAKAIKAHFEKHPLAIVNIKGRAKGTSAQEVIYNLEQATGAVLVSQEPSKVILYRGWGSGVEPNPASGTTKRDSKYNSTAGKVKTRLPISPELISAIRLECGLKSVNEEPLVASEATADGSMDEFSIGN
ncbi:hypothetical protein CDL12_03706 [Handroanthus impetiginosus]|uniref:CRM domain-containing protein n=1 Tax=Handroanthus impetiginosus TaxID=429701 RepID=A0A2G9I1S5_9LAMI|nr:hypothetical protein CDL12_03706 [Handroanthus impetiginosus]